ncbi:unnamed protein product [Spodoptera littoralis]|uniref:WH2 domain-containing protein n=1 Tax=Spodoptera littoralis TaxID=7109 RepID=A0A9P0IDH7_SPOLI|nr:unnamed protein product [Spodoptera littoralis]CAH1643200.1 unnamed protein product [Spodoptera littoralis]
MNVFINIVCMSLITFVNAGDINYDTILTILKERRTNLLNPDEKNEIVETMPVIPGFYLQKPNEISSSLFKNPTQWPDALFSNLNSINKSQTEDKVIKDITRDGYLDAKIIKAVKNLNKYRESQKSSIDKLGIWKSNSNGDDNVQNAPVKVLVSHVLNSIKNEDIAKKKLKAQKDREKLENDKVLKQILMEIKGNNRYEKKEKRKKVKKTDNDKKKAKLEALLRNLLKMEKSNSDDVTSSESSESSEEDSYTKESKDGGNILEDILNALNNNDKSIEKSKFPGINTIRTFECFKGQCRL